MKKTLLLSIVLSVSLTVNADIYSHSGTLLTTQDALPYADFAGASLEGADLSYANLSYANFSGADLLDAHFSYSTLTGANFHDAFLRWASFGWADLRGANLYSAFLHTATFAYSDLSGADLRRADFYESNFRYADLSGANLNNASRWSDGRFENALYTTETIFPTGFDPVAVLLGMGGLALRRRRNQ
jgi:uncharacterized protein YjbI with pentapeptide repeats